MNYLDYTTYGIAKYVSPGQPTFSIVGAQLYDLYVDKDTGIQWHCIDPTYGNQTWLGSDGSIIASVLSDLNRDLLYYFNGDIDNTTIVDQSSANNDGTMLGTVSLGEGPTGNTDAFVFSTNNNFRTINPTTSTDPLDWAFSTYYLATTFTVADYSTIVGSGSSLSTSYATATYLADTRFYSGDVNAIYCSGPQLPISTNLQFGTWYHIVFNYTAGSFRVWVNNVSNLGDASGTRSNNLTYLGGTSTGDFLIGKLWRPRYYDRSLSAAEIAELYNEGVT